MIHFTLTQNELVLLVIFAIACVGLTFMLGAAAGVYLYKRALHIPQEELLSETTTLESREYHRR